MGGKGSNQFSPMLARRDIACMDDDINEMEEFYLTEIEHIHNDDLLAKLQKRSNELRQKISAKEQILKNLKSLGQRTYGTQSGNMKTELKTLRESLKVITNKLQSFAFNSLIMGKTEKTDRDQIQKETNTSLEISSEKEEESKVRKESYSITKLTKSDLKLKFSGSVSAGSISKSNPNTNRDIDSVFNVIGKSDQILQVKFKETIDFIFDTESRKNEENKEVTNANNFINVEAPTE
jgi:hypothetical protein